MKIFADIAIGWECGHLLPNEPTTLARHRTDAEDPFIERLDAKKALDGWECWTFPLNGNGSEMPTDLEESTEKEMSKALGLM